MLSNKQAKTQGTRKRYGLKVISQHNSPRDHIMQKEGSAVEFARSPREAYSPRRANLSPTGR